MKNQHDTGLDLGIGSGGGSVASLEDFLGVNVEHSRNDTDNDDTLDLVPKGDELDIVDVLPTDTDDNDTDKNKDKDKNVEPSPNTDTDDNNDEDKGNGKPVVDLEDIVSDTLDYKSVLKSLMKQGVIDEFESVVDEEGNEIPIDKLDVNEEVLSDIIKQKIEHVKEEVTSNKISVDGISEFTKKLIEIDKKGGDIRQALDLYNNIKTPLEQIDLSTKEGQQQALYMKYKAKGLGDREISRMIKGFDADGVLEEEATSAYDELSDAFNKHIENIEKQAEDRKKQAEKALKEYRNKLLTNLKGFDLKDSYRKKLADLATKKDKETGMYLMDKMYNEIRHDPEKATELLLYLADRDTFIKTITSNIDKKVKTDVMRKLKFTPKVKSSINIKDKKTSDKSTGIDLDKIFE